MKGNKSQELATEDFLQTRGALFVVERGQLLLVDGLYIYIFHAAICVFSRLRKRSFGCPEINSKGSKGI